MSTVGQGTFHLSLLLYRYLVVENGPDNRPRGATKHKILGYQLFKENYVKKVRVKPNVKSRKAAIYC